jgi:hypothetical protein
VYLNNNENKENAMKQYNIDKIILLLFLILNNNINDTNIIDPCKKLPAVSSVK